MKIKVFMEKLGSTMLSFIRIVVLSRIVSTKRISSPQHKEVVILANGPSLSSLLEKHSDFLANKEIICVNHFAESDVYQEIKPTYYVLAAPEMWMDDVEDFHYQKGERLFSSIAERTQWPITLFIPHNAKKYSRWKKKISSNPNISIVYISMTPIEGFQSFCHWAFKRWLGMPRPHNVLIPSLMISINMGFQTTFITGADHSWMKELFVADDNTVYLTINHFYDDKDARTAPMDKLGKGSRKMHEILIKFVHSFRGYFTIRKFAESKGLKIINVTEGSFIDAFERQKLNGQK